MQPCLKKPKKIEELVGKNKPAGDPSLSNTLITISPTTAFVDVTTVSLQRSDKPHVGSTFSYRIMLDVY